MMYDYKSVETHNKIVTVTNIVTAAIGLAGVVAASIALIGGKKS